jgi:hypothetical protein
MAAGESTPIVSSSARSRTMKPNAVASATTPTHANKIHPVPTENANATYESSMSAGRSPLKRNVMT